VHWWTQRDFYELAVSAGFTIAVLDADGQPARDAEEFFTFRLTVDATAEPTAVAEPLLLGLFDFIVGENRTDRS
jgi:hypothetical protein